MPGSATRKPKPATITVTLSADMPALQTVPDIGNPWRLQTQALVSLVRVAQGADPRCALEAAKFLLEYATNEVSRREAKKAELYGPRRGAPIEQRPDRKQILEELRGLYAKALPSTLIVESQSPESGDAENAS